jgi:hypothetical protein
MEGYRGRTTIGEMYEMGIGTIDYMYYQLYLQHQTEQGRKNMQNRRMQEEFEDANMM